MNLYHISQTANQNYDTYDSAVVAAVSPDKARHTNPEKGGAFGDPYSGWCNNPSEVTVRYLGKATSGTKAGVVCASYNAG